MSTAPQDKNRVLVLDIYRSVEARDFGRCLELVSPDCRTHVGGNVLDREAWAGMGQMFMNAFPDGRHVHGDGRTALEAAARARRQLLSPSTGA